MRSLPSSFSAELAKEANFLGHLVEFQFSTPMYYTDLDIDVVYGGKTYSAWGMEIGEVSYVLDVEVDHIQIQMDNTTLGWSPYVMGSEEVRGKTVDLYIAAFSAHGVCISAHKFFSGILDGLSINHDRVTIDVYSPLIMWRRKIPRRVHQSTCPWTFKDSATCRYIGAESWCDQHFARCQALNNTINFGGYRWLAAMVNKVIKWGGNWPSSVKQ